MNVLAFGFLFGFLFFFFQAEDGIRDADVTGVQTCALPIFGSARPGRPAPSLARVIYGLAGSFETPQPGALPDLRPRRPLRSPPGASPSRRPSRLQRQPIWRDRKSVV